MSTRSCVTGCGRPARDGHLTCTTCSHLNRGVVRALVTDEQVAGALVVADTFGTPAMIDGRPVTTDERRRGRRHLRRVAARKQALAAEQQDLLRQIGVRS